MAPLPGVQMQTAPTLERAGAVVAVLNAENVSAVTTTDVTMTGDSPVVERVLAVGAREVSHGLLPLRTRLGNRRLRVLLRVLRGYPLPRTRVPVVPVVTATALTA